MRMEGDRGRKRDYGLANGVCLNDNGVEMVEYGMVCIVRRQESVVLEGAGDIYGISAVAGVKDLPIVH